jgi:hypothetical protein
MLTLQPCPFSLSWTQLVWTLQESLSGFLCFFNLYDKVYLSKRNKQPPWVKIFRTSLRNTFETSVDSCLSFTPTPSQKEKEQKQNLDDQKVWDKFMKELKAKRKSWITKNDDEEADDEPQEGRARKKNVARCELQSRPSDGVAQRRLVGVCLPLDDAKLVNFKL